MDWVSTAYERRAVLRPAEVAALGAVAVGASVAIGPASVEVHAANAATVALLSTMRAARPVRSIFGGHARPLELRAIVGGRGICRRSPFSTLLPRHAETSTACRGNRGPERDHFADLP
jgi:hypothetical protein